MKAQASPLSPPTPAEAAALLDQVNADPTIARVAGAARRLMPHAKALTTLKVRIGIVSSFTIEPLKPFLELHALRAGIFLETFFAPFGRFDQELIDPASGLAKFNPDAVIVAVRLEDVCPEFYEGFNSLPPQEAADLVTAWLERFTASLSAFRQRSSAAILISNYSHPPSFALGIADRNAHVGQQESIRWANSRLVNLADKLENVFVMDYDALVAQHGRLRWSDRRNALYARIPIAPANYWAFAGFVIRHLRPLYGLTKKVLVLDADNTLWGGVIGDAGAGGIALGPDYPGNAFVAFQKRVLDLFHRGIVLCLASKNEPGIVEEALARHPCMVLKREHFAAIRVNWEPKPRNVQAMAEELNLDLESFVFVDDSEVECALMRETLPQVLSVALPREPAEYAAVIESLDCFDQWGISQEDRRRGSLYVAEAGRKQLAAMAVDMPTFYRSLGMKVTLAVNDAAQIARAAQMTQRTNQFNMNTIRLTEDDVRRLMNDPACEVVTLALADRFGDSGVVGLAIVRRVAAAWTLEQFLMSCRILGRTVEQAFIAWIARRARDAGAQALFGLFTPTTKNKPFAEFYASCGFSIADDTMAGSGPQRLTLKLCDADTRVPDWIELNVADGPGAS